MRIMRFPLTLPIPVHIATLYLNPTPRSFSPDNFTKQRDDPKYRPMAPLPYVHQFSAAALGRPADKTTPLPPRIRRLANL
ncbi:hypothetical protein M0R45_011090 [Rubus argutus]|uniref:Uncharacterized protein n=1 Tax=Rubus argutus TaxID=59490 RepID=A0AAW1Y9Q6_RUBAR